MPVAPPSSSRRSSPYPPLPSALSNLVRIHGRLAAIERHEPLTPAEAERLLRQMLDGHADKTEEFDREGEVDFAYSVEAVGRFRVNAFRQRGSISIVMRSITLAVRSLDELRLPPVLHDIADEERGLILLTGTTGSGKSTTLAAMLDQINTTKPRHIVTIEDPIEYLHRDRASIINQREVGSDTGSFKRAMRRVLRQDPDVILIGEMRDEETVRSALSAAETGHLVLSSVHTIDAPETVNRIIDFFPPHEQHQARAMLAGTLKGIISQRLVPTPTGDGRVAVCEILRMTGRVRDMIMDPDETGRLREVIAEASTTGCRRSTRRCSATARPAGCRRRTRYASPPARTTSSCWSPRTAGPRPRWMTSSTGMATGIAPWRVQSRPSSPAPSRRRPAPGLPRRRPGLGRPRRHPHRPSLPRASRRSAGPRRSDQTLFPKTDRSASVREALR
jgi:twitching motility protein PilT